MCCSSARSLLKDLSQVLHSKVGAVSASPPCVGLIVLLTKRSIAGVAYEGRCMDRRVFHVLLERSFAFERSVAGVAFEFGRVRRRVQMLLESLLAYERSATVVALERRVVALERRRQYNNNGSCYLSRLRPSDWESRALSRVATD